MRPDHERWLRDRALPALCGDHPSWVFIRGFASRLGSPEENQTLSRRRALGVYDHLVARPCTDPQRITAVDAVGESWGPPSPRDNSPRWRAVEVIITPARRRESVELPDIQRRPHMIRRRVKCRLVDTAPTLRGGRGHGGADHAEEIVAVERALYDMVDPEHRVSCDHRMVQDDLRVIRIRVYTDRVSSLTVSSATPIVEYTWGNPSNGAVSLVDERDPRRPVRRAVSRAEAHRWYATPGHVLLR